VISTVAEADLPDLLPLMRGYCDFYEVAPSDEALLAMSRELIASPELDGTQLIARDEQGRAVGFATIFWTWSTLSATRIAVMNDLFVAEHARGSGAAEALIRACAERAGERGATSLDWQTAHNNHRAKKLYDRVGGKRDERWLDYSLEP
jgi:ribosomal protein S18 acetylase RimI-like enzyme